MDQQLIIDLLMVNMGVGGERERSTTHYRSTHGQYGGERGINNSL